MVDGGWETRGLGGGAIRGGRWPMVDGGWWGFGGGTILMIIRWFCAIGFIMQFLIFELGVEDLQRAAEFGAEAGLVAVEAFEAARIVYQMQMGRALGRGRRYRLRGPG